MAKFEIWGGKPLGGTIDVLGAKNAAIIMIAASLLVKHTELDNVPQILDIEKIIKILEKLGVKFRRNGHHLAINTTGLRLNDPDANLVGQIRASVLLIGPMLARLGKVRLAHPGGCTIGKRPIDLHLRAFRDLGVKVKEDDDCYEFSYDGAKTSSTIVIKFEKISVGATENILLFSSAMARNVIITNAAIEPEIQDLCEFLKCAGAKIKIDGRRIEITGTDQLSDVKHQVLPDRIEAGTFAIMAAATKSNLKINHCEPERLRSLLEVFRTMGVEFAKGKDSLYIKTSPRLSAIQIKTAEYPGYPTDLQPPLGLLMTQAEGTSTIRENIFEHRLEYLHELSKMGAKIKILNQHEAEISGYTKLSGTRIESLDLRAGATLLLAGLCAEGKTTILDAENIDRGYERIEERLQKLGANIKRIN